VSISGDLTHVLVGFVLPFSVVLGTFISGIFTQLIVNPMLQHAGYLPTWRPGANAIYTQFATNLDLWMSVNIGVNIAIALIGIGMAVSILRQYMRNRQAEGTRTSFSPPPGRGDFNWQLAIGAFFLCQAVYVALGHWLVPKFPLLVLVFFGFLYTPAMSYVSARLYGLAGRGVGMPYLREAVFIKSGYTGIDIWFAPWPQHDYGWAAQRFREVELTGTKFTSIVKVEAFMLPVLLLASFIFWAFFWYTSAIPSSQFPYAQMFWPLHVTYRVLWMSATTGGSAALDQFLGAIRAEVIVPSTLLGLAGYWVITAAKLPVLFYYGLVGGLGQLVHATIPMMIGALLGRHYFSKRFGEHEWHRYAPVLLAGFSCGMGLVAMVAIALGLITKSVSFLPF
jgi:hypothetical protein